MRSAPRRSSTGCCGATAFRRCRSGPRASSCAAAATMRRCARWKSAAILFTVLLAFMEIRHAVNGGDVYRDIAGLTESRAAGLRRAGDGDRPGAAADSQRQHRPQCRRGLADGVCRTCHRVRADAAGERRSSGRSMSAASSSILLLLAYAMPAVLALLLSYAVAGRRAASYANTIAAGALMLALTYVTFEIRRLYHGPVLTQRRDQRRRAIHLFDRLAGVRRGAARHRHPVQFAARPARFRGRDRADDPQGVPDRHVDADGRLPRAVVHVPGAGAGGDRLALPAHPVPQANAAGRAGGAAGEL